MSAAPPNNSGSIQPPSKAIALVPVAIRFFLAIVLILVGILVGGALGTTLGGIGSAVLIAELAGYGISQAQAEQLVAFLEQEAAKYRPQPHPPP